MKIAIIMGTRPGIVKMAPVYHAISGRKTLKPEIVYTGQHYSDSLRQQTWSYFDLPEPAFEITGIDQEPGHMRQISRMMIGCQEYVDTNKPDAILVCGDANTNFAAGLCARKSDLILGHVESGLRSYDWKMPEEHNRVMLDHISDLLYAPTKLSFDTLIEEKVQGKPYLVGNTAVDSLFYMRDASKFVKPSFISKESEFILFTAHRQENVDDFQRLSSLCRALEKLTKEHIVIFPIHPRTQKMLSYFDLLDNLKALKNLQLVAPLSYGETLYAIQNALVVITDSGGLQEEACILGTPTVTIRENTERPETVEVGSNIIAGTDTDQVIYSTNFSLEKKRASWRNPFGNGSAADQIADSLEVL